jgi:hypothetical protein
MVVYQWGVSVALQSRGEGVYLEGVEGCVSVEGELRLNPSPCAVVLGFKAHEEHGVDRVNNGVANPACNR